MPCLLAVKGAKWPQHGVLAVKGGSAAHTAKIVLTACAWLPAEEAAKQPRRGKGKGKPWQRKGCRLHNVRKLIIRLKGFLFPRNTNFTAGQALQYIQAHTPPSRHNSSNV